MRANRCDACVKGAAFDLVVFVKERKCVCVCVRLITAVLMDFGRQTATAMCECTHFAPLDDVVHEMVGTTRDRMFDCFCIFLSTFFYEVDAFRAIQSMELTYSNTTTKTHKTLS